MAACSSWHESHLTFTSFTLTLDMTTDVPAEEALFEPWADTFTLTRVPLSAVMPGIGYSDGRGELCEDWFGGETALIDTANAALSVYTSADAFTLLATPHDPYHWQIIGKDLYGASGAVYLGNPFLGYATWAAHCRARKGKLIGSPQFPLAQASATVTVVDAGSGTTFGQQTIIMSPSIWAGGFGGSYPPGTSMDGFLRLQNDRLDIVIQRTPGAPGFASKMVALAGYRNIPINEPLFGTPIPIQLTEIDGGWLLAFVDEWGYQPVPAMAPITQTLAGFTGYNVPSTPPTEDLIFRVEGPGWNDFVSIPMADPYTGNLSGVFETTFENPPGSGDEYTFTVTLTM